jgi:hypothetical protein
VPDPQSFTDAEFPAQGVERTTEYQQQRDGTTARGVNVRAFETLTGRARGGSRPGLTKFIDAQVVP